MRSSIITLFLFLSVGLFGQKSKEAYEYSIVFASCFQNDLVGVKISGSSIVADQPLTSDSLTGITNFSLYQDHDAVWINTNNTKQRFPKFTIKKRLALSIMLNQKWTRFDIDLKKGKVIFVNNCFVKDDTGTKQRLQITQRKRPVQLY